MRLDDRGAFVLLRSGVRWYPDAPRVEDVRFEDFRSLSFIARWSGHAGTEPYSVADHCVRVAEVLDEMGAPIEVQLQGLVHDLHEIYPPGDVPGPMLRGESALARELRAQEKRARDTLRTALGLPLEFDPRVKHADLVLLATEARDLMPSVTTDGVSSADVFAGLPEPRRWTMATLTARGSCAYWNHLFIKLGGKLP